MIQRVLNSKNFIAVLLAMATGTVLYFKMPWPMTVSPTPHTWNEYFLRLIALRDPWAYAGLKASYQVMLFTTPYIGSSLLLSALYIFALRTPRRVKQQPLPPYPAIQSRSELYVVIGEIHHPREFTPAENPYWLTIPARGLFTGTIIIGATGAGKTACSMYPFTDQLLGFKAEIPDERLSGIVLEVKGDFCGKVRTILKDHGRESDYTAISLNSEWAYNPLHNELDGYSMAVGIANLLNSLFGKGKEPFWQQAYTNLVKFTIILHKYCFGYVTLFDVYECAISARVLEKKIRQAEVQILGKPFLAVSREIFQSFAKELTEAGFEADETGQLYRVLDSPAARGTLQRVGLEVTVQHESGPNRVDEDLKGRLESVKRWYYDDWSNIDKKLQSSVVEGISVFLSLFDDNPPIKRLFCPPKELYEPDAVPIRGKRALPPIRELLESGKIVALDFPAGENPGLARAVAVMLKMDFQRAMLNRIARMANEPEKHWRPVVFVCDEYQQVATVTEHEPNGDDQFFSLSRQAKCIPIVATQSISSLRSILPGESWRTLLQTFRTKIFLTQSDDFSAKIASDLCGQENVWKVNYNISESGHDSKVSYLTGKPLADKAHISTSKTYSQQRDSRFDMKAFTELKNAQSITLAYDGVSPLPPMYCYLKPNHRDVNKNYFLQLQDKEL
ncbi:MAG: TraM recognition domain-containing protein [Candidatus Acidiferrum sp.]